MASKEVKLPTSLSLSEGACQLPRERLPGECQAKVRLWADNNQAGPRDQMRTGTTLIKSSFSVLAAKQIPQLCQLVVVSMSQI